MMIPQEMVVAKAEVESTVAELWQFIEGAARQATAAHVVEEELFRKLLALGRQLYARFLALQGTGDVGERFTLPDGRPLQRLEKTHQRLLQTIFGEFSLDRAVYGTREGQAIEAVPLDARLQLPESKFSHLLQNWDQLLATEQPYGQVSKVMEMILGLSQHVDSLERMSRGMSAIAEEFCWSIACESFFPASASPWETRFLATSPWPTCKSILRKVIRCTTWRTSLRISSLKHGRLNKPAGKTSSWTWPGWSTPSKSSSTRKAQKNPLPLGEGRVRVLPPRR